MTCEDDEPGEWFDSDDEAPGLAELGACFCFAVACAVMGAVAALAAVGVGQ